MKNPRSSTKFVFFPLIGKTRWHPRPLIGWNIFDFSETAEWNLAKLDRNEEFKVLYKDCVFRADRKKTRWPPRHLINWAILDYSSGAAYWSLVKLERMQDLNVLCLFFSGRPTNQGLSPWHPIGWYFFYSFFQLPNGICGDLTGSRFLFFWTIRKPWWLSWPLIGWNIFLHSNGTAERNSMKRDKK